MALKLPLNFENDIELRDTALIPVVLIGNSGTEYIAISTNTLAQSVVGYNTLPILLNLPSLKESINFEN